VSAGGPEACALQQHHQRNPVPHCEFGDAIALGVAAGADTARQRGEVFRAHHDGCAVEQSGADDDSVGRDVTADQGAQLVE
jgi:hypothetical protein